MGSDGGKSLLWKEVDVGDEVGFDLATANSNPVWEMTACCG